MITLRRLREEDAKMIFEWRNSDFIKNLGSQQREVSWEEHKFWIQNSIGSSDRLVLIIEYEQTAIGQVRFDKNKYIENSVFISIYLLQTQINKGIGSQALDIAIGYIFKEWDTIHSIIGLVRNDNISSQFFFKKNNFSLLSTSFTENHQTFELSKTTFLNQQNIKLYNNLIENYGLDVKSLNWGSKQSQELRFKILSQVGNMTNKFVLDVGCGLGDFYEYLTDNHIKCEYKGIDITPKMVEMAKKRFPEAHFEVLDILKEDTLLKSPDFIVASGIFAYQNKDFLQKFSSRTFELAKSGIAFNSLSTHAKDQEDGEFYADPIETLKYCQSITPWVVLRQDYHSRDFTIYMYKKPQNNYDSSH